MTPDELESMLRQQEGPKLEFKLEYSYPSGELHRGRGPGARQKLIEVEAVGTVF